MQTSAEVQEGLTLTVSLPISGLVEPVWSTSRPAVRTAVRVGGDVRVPIGPLNPGRGPTCSPQRARGSGWAWLRDGPASCPSSSTATYGSPRGSCAPTSPARYWGSTTAPGPTWLQAVRRQVADGRTAGRGGSDPPNYLRAEAEPVSFKVDLPDDVRRFDYALQPDGPRQSAMLMFRLTDKPAGREAPSSPRGSSPPEPTSRSRWGRPSARSAGEEALGPCATGVRRLGNRLQLQDPARLELHGFDLQPGRIVVTVSGSGSITYGFPPFAATDGWTFTVRQPVALLRSSAGH